MNFNENAKIEEKKNKGRAIAIARVWMRYNIYMYLASLGLTVIGLIVMHDPSNKTLIPNIQIIEFAYTNHEN